MLVFIVNGFINIVWFKGVFLKINSGLGLRKYLFKKFFK